MNDADKLRVMLDTITAWTQSAQDTLKRASKPAEAFTKDIEKLGEELDRLGKQQDSVKSFRAMRGELAGTSKELAAAQARFNTLSRGMRASGPPSQQMIGELASARGALIELGTRHKSQTQAVRELRDELGRAGLGTRELAAHHRKLNADIADTRNALDRATQAEERRKRLAENAQVLKETGESLREAGKSVLEGLHKAIDASKEVDDARAQIRALGVDEQTARQAERYARTANSPGISMAGSLGLMRDSLQMTSTEALAETLSTAVAKMQFSNLAKYDDKEAKANNAKVTALLAVAHDRDGFKDAAGIARETDAIQKLMNLSAGDIKPAEWAGFMKAGGDAAKGLSTDALYFQMKSLFDTVGSGAAAGKGMAALVNQLSQGHTTAKATQNLVDLGFIDRKAVHHGKDGAVTGFDQGALRGDALLQRSPLAWVDAVLVPALAKKGIKDDDKVAELLNSILPNADAAKLLMSIYQHRADMKQDEDSGSKAAGVDASAQAASRLTRAKEAAVHAQFDTLKAQIGETVTPLYNSGLDMAVGALTKLNAFITNHSGATRVIGTVVAAVAGLVFGLGSLLGVLSSVVSAYALVRNTMSVLGLRGSLLTRGLGLASGGWRMLAGSATAAGRVLASTASSVGGAMSTLGTRALDAAGAAWRGLGNGAAAGGRIARNTWTAGRGAAGAVGSRLASAGGGIWNALGSGAARAASGLRLVGGAVTTVGRLLLTTPIGAVIAVIALAAYAIYRNWEPIKAFLVSMGEAIGRVFSWIGEQLSSVFGGSLSGILQTILNWSPIGAFYQVFAGVLKWFGVDLPGAFTEFGANLIKRLIDGVSSVSLSGLWKSITDNPIYKALFGDAKEEPAGQDPAAAGGTPEQQAAQRAARVKTGAKAAAAAISGAAAALPAGAAAVPPPSAPITTPTVPIDRRPPLNAAARGTPFHAPTVSSNVTINVYPTPGMDERAVANLIKAALDKQAAQDRQRATAALTD
ncbi:hypothetical protein [Burkholderia gladioli]|uniref:hypothetical protein n=1 Tax=Burkholderia gladioli TaxID=28095 RepID=UPI0016415600|nr:hypothetical protein [Burkholderia gladioli]